MTVKYETTVYKSNRAFRVPEAERDKLGIGDGDSVHVIVRTMAGHELFSGRKTLRSDADIYGKVIAPILTPGATILIELSQPETVYRTPSESAQYHGPFVEGKRVRVLVSRWERNRKARQQCIGLFGTTCCVCDFDFGRFYGELGKGFIHVHHLTPGSDSGSEYQVNPETDLRPVCPNCHEMLHSGSHPPISIEELRTIIATQKVQADSNATVP